MICGIVLAAGRSRRMGEPKAMLSAGDDTFLRHAIHALRAGGCAYVVVVTGRLDDETALRIAEDAAAEDANKRVVIVGPSSRCFHDPDVITAVARHAETWFARHLIASPPPAQS
jgi:CTP:molybdopterin cytidylyltransferase MocA